MSFCFGDGDDVITFRSDMRGSIIGARLENRGVNLSRMD